MPSGIFETSFRDYSETESTARASDILRPDALKCAIPTLQVETFLTPCFAELEMAYNPATWRTL